MHKVSKQRIFMLRGCTYLHWQPIALRYWSSRVMTSSMGRFRETRGRFRCVTSPSETAPLRRCRQISWSAGRPTPGGDRPGLDDRRYGSASATRTSPQDRGPSGMETKRRSSESPRRWPLPPTSKRENRRWFDAGTTLHRSTPASTTRTSLIEQCSRHSAVCRDSIKLSHLKQVNYAINSILNWKQLGPLIHLNINLKVILLIH